MLVYAVLLLFYASFLLWLPSLTRFLGGVVVGWWGGGWWGLRKDFDTGLLCLVVKTICPSQPFTGFPARFLSCKIVKKLPLNFSSLFFFFSVSMVKSKHYNWVSKNANVHILLLSYFGS